MSLLQVTMPPDYPGESPPIYMLSAPWLKGLKRQELCGYLEDIYLENAGESIVYMWVERIREFMVEQSQLSEQEAEEQQVTTDLASVKLEQDTEDLTPCPDIFSGEIISDRKSHFQPHLAGVKSQAEVRQVLRKLYENKKIANATHNMYAYRFTPEGSTNVNQNCEDDGEIHAGGRLLHLLQILDAKDVLVVVTRWYGGIHLGPDRFKHINNSARQILDSCGYISTHSDKNKKNKKVK
ncbi:protein IMPACT-B-like isoform X2 [Homarus americanus]|nr:protein IMPACT-B-like isoform X2 [Homarus americanus]